jgi:hypothetical protein
MNLIGPINSGTAVGGDGEATANADSPNPVRGLIRAIYVKYNDSPPGTTDVTIASKGTAPLPATRSVLVLTNANTNGWFAPRMPVQDTAGADLTYDGTRKVTDLIPVYDHLNIKIEGANAGDSADVWLLVEEC